MVIDKKVRQPKVRKKAVDYIDLNTVEVVDYQERQRHALNASIVAQRMSSEDKNKLEDIVEIMRGKLSNNTNKKVITPSLNKKQHTKNKLEK